MENSNQRCATTGSEGWETWPKGHPQGRAPGCSCPAAEPIQQGDANPQETHTASSRSLHWHHHHSSGDKQSQPTTGHKTGKHRALQCLHTTLCACTAKAIAALKAEQRRWLGMRSTCSRLQASGLPALGTATTVLFSIYLLKISQCSLQIGATIKKHLFKLLPEDKSTECTYRNFPFNCWVFSPTLLHLLLVGLREQQLIMNKQRKTSEWFLRADKFN